jgi:hypothetical protein
MRWVCGLKTKNVTFPFANSRKDEENQIIDYDTDTSLTFCPMTSENQNYWLSITSIIVKKEEQLSSELHV